MAGTAWCITVVVGLQTRPVIPAAELERIRCAVLAIPQIIAAVRSGHKPLLIVNGNESGHITAHPQSCRDTANVTTGVHEVHFAKPGFAERVYGKRGQDGVVDVQYIAPPHGKK
jgi:hypothetical protein